MMNSWMKGNFPPPAMVALIKLSSSWINCQITSSPLMASRRCLGVILLTACFSDKFPANSKTSAVIYSRIAAQQTAAEAPTLLFEVTLSLRNLWILPTGNWGYFLLTQKISKLNEAYLQTRFRRPALRCALWFADFSSFPAFASFSCDNLPVTSDYHYWWWVWIKIVLWFMP